MQSDGLPVGDVGFWAKQKHQYLERYIDISKKTRAKYLPPLGHRGAVYIDLFCGAGRAQIRGTTEIVDGSSVTAWKASVKGAAPFTKMFICDLDPDLLNASVRRLETLGAPVQGYCLEASKAAEAIAVDVQKMYPYGLHFAFLDPFNLEALNFEILSHLAKIRRMDLLIHLSAMDLQRNLASNLNSSESAFDVFAPGWRERVDTNGTQVEVRKRVVEYWRGKVESLGVWPSPQQRLITGERSQPLYWLLLAARHELAHEFWEVASNPEGQGSLFD